MIWVEHMDDDYTLNRLNRKRELTLVEQLILTGGYCVLCGYHLDPQNIEMHHVAGRKHDDFMMPVCHNCHQTLSRAQSSWPKEWLSSNQPPEMVMALILRGHSDIDKLKSLQLREISNFYIEKCRREGV